MDFVGLYPNYSVKFYREGFYKLVRFKRPLMPHLPPQRVGEKSSDFEGKFSQAYSRARSVVFQLALCNDWDYFITCTIDGAKYDRYDLKKFYTDFSQWIRDFRKKYSCRIEYFFVPELHENGAWHLHGMIRGIPDSMSSAISSENRIDRMLFFFIIYLPSSFVFLGLKSAMQNSNRYFMSFLHVFSFSQFLLAFGLGISIGCLLTLNILTL